MQQIEMRLVLGTQNDACIGMSLQPELETYRAILITEFTVERIMVPLDTRPIVTVMLGRYRQLVVITVLPGGIDKLPIDSVPNAQSFSIALGQTPRLARGATHANPPLPSQL